MDLSSKPKISDLMNEVAAKIPHKWMEIGFQLGLSLAKIEAIKYQHHRESTKIFIDIFDHWEKQPGDEPKTWSTVIEALKTPLVAEETLAHELEEMMSINSLGSLTLGRLMDYCY